MSDLERCDYLKLIDDAIQQEIRKRATFPGETFAVHIFDLTLEFSRDGVCTRAERLTETRERLW